MGAIRLDCCVHAMWRF